MQKREVKKIKCLLALLLLIFTLYSIFYIAHEKFHECHGEHCPICQLLLISEQNIKLLTLALTFAAVFLPARFKNVKENLISCEPTLKSNTLVSQKIKLNV